MPPGAKVISSIASTGISSIKMRNLETTVVYFYLTVIMGVY